MCCPTASCASYCRCSPWERSSTAALDHERPSWLFQVHAAGEWRFPTIDTILATLITSLELTMTRTISLTFAAARRPRASGQHKAGRVYLCHVCVFKAPRTYTPVLGALVSPLGTHGSGLVYCICHFLASTHYSTLLLSSYSAAPGGAGRLGRPGVGRLVRVGLGHLAKHHARGFVVGFAEKLELGGSKLLGISYNLG